MTTVKDIQAKLAEPFAAEDIEWRVQRAGVSGQAWAMVLAYVTNRAIMHRLDETVGMDRWRNEYTTAPDGGVMCGLSIKFSDEWVTKYDGAENTQVEAVKGGLSNAMKRAAVQWGVGRYLYNLEATFVPLTKEKPIHMAGWHVHYDTQSKTRYYWQAPKLPKWALPESEVKDGSN